MSNTGEGPTAVQVLDGLPDGVVGVGPDGQVTALNTVAATMLRCARREALGRPLAEVLTLLDRDGRSWTEINQPFSGLVTRTGVPEQVWVGPDGHEVLTKARIHRDGPRGPVAAVLITLRDGRGRARLDRDRSDLVATVAHELRSPLTGVKGFVQALLKRWDRLEDEQRKLMLQTVHADAERLSRLITELLDVARLDTGRLSIHPRPVDAVALARRVVESIGQGAGTTIELVTERPVHEIHADPDKFTQVLTNLVENGVRHGEGQVTVSIREVEDGGALVVVTDTGRGIPIEVRTRVFTKFWTSGASGGTGLGMYLVNGLVRAQGGQLAIDDAEGGGARITVTWPPAAY